MRMLVLRLAAVIGLLLGIGGCMDAVTLPAGGDQRATDAAAVAPLQDGQLSYVCCDPVVIIVPRCDPYMELDWCKDDGGECISSQPGTENPDGDDLGLAGCGEFGGGGSGGSTLPGGGGTTPRPKPCPDYGCPPPDGTCDPAIHPTCEKPLTSTDSATINNALAAMLRTTFSDTTAARACAELAGLFRNAFAGGYVFRGDFDSNATNDPQGEHYGAYNPTTRHIHYDPWGLDAANRGDPAAILEVAITALHEGAHWGGYRHPAGPTFDATGRDFYTEYPFNHLNQGPNSCIPR